MKIRADHIGSVLIISGYSMLAFGYRLASLIMLFGNISWIIYALIHKPIGRNSVLFTNGFLSVASIFGLLDYLL